MIGSPAAPGTARRLARPPHAPERGWSWRLLRSFHVTGVFWYRFHCWVVRTFPPPVLVLFIYFFQVAFFLCLRRIRAAIASNLEPVLGACGWWERQRRIWRTMLSFGWCLTERYERLSTQRPFHLEMENAAHLMEVSGPGAGILFVTAHLGNYEVGSMLPAEVGSRPVHLVREPEADPKAQAFIQDVLAGFTQTRYSMHFQNSDPLQGLALLDALRRGEIVAVQGDRPRAGTRAIEATLFGKPFPLPPGPAALARTSGVPMLPVFVFRERRRRYRVVFRPPIRVARTDDASADLTTAMRQVAAEVEWAIRAAPHQWFCFKQLWP
ncbi:MAG TPA: lysophospholipid acyltransferase family protein [Candidatus Polarisedimenticolia bacterium]|nr:lysophospholipid acyltransferase family protein [Candidatus Polarisedimenticolia bacterium]